MGFHRTFGDVDKAVFGLIFALYLYKFFFLVLCISVTNWTCYTMRFMCKAYLLIFFLIYHTYFMQNIECIYRFDSKWNSVGPEPLYVNLMLHIASSTISTSGGFGMKMPLLPLLSELWLLLFYTLFSVFPSYHTRFQLWERQTIKITLVKYSFLKRNIIV